MKKSTIFLIALLISAELLSGQNQFTVHGRVLDHEGDPLVGVTIVEQGTTRGVVSDEQGYYRLALPADGVMEFSYVGFVSQVIQVAGREFIDVQMEYDTQHLEQEVEVLAPYIRQTSSNHDKVTQPELQQSNIGQNLPFLLSTVPGVQVTSDDGLGVGYTYFRVRGTDHTRINMTVNGVSLNDQESQAVFWVNMTDMASSLSQVDVQRGVGTSANGPASFGASMNMLTGDNAPHSHYELSFNGGSYNTFREMVNAHIVLPNRVRANARFSKVNSDGFLYRAGSDLYSYYTDLGFYGDRTQVVARFFGGKEKTGMAWDGVDYNTAYGINGADRRYNPAGEYTDADGKTAYYANQTDNYAQQHAQLSLTHRITTSLRLNATAHYTHGGGYYEQYENKALGYLGLLPYINAEGNKVKKSDAIYRKNLNNHFYGAILSAQYVSESVQAEIGTAANHYIGHHYGELLWLNDSLYAKQVPYAYEFYRSKSSKIDANIYAKANWHIINSPKERLSLFADLQYRYVRYRLSGINNEALKQYITEPDKLELPLLVQHHFFNPKAGLTYIRGGHLLYATFGIANRDPSRSNYTENLIYDKTIGTYTGKMPKAETLYDYELGYTYRHDRFAVGANFYLMDYDNQLVLTGAINDVGAQLTTNVKDSYRLGVELTAGVRIAEWMRWDANCVLSRNKILNYTETITEYDENWNWVGEREVTFKETTIAFSPSVTAMSLFTFEVAGFTGTVKTLVTGKQYLDNTQNETAALKAYTTTDIGLHYRLPLPEWTQAGGKDGLSRRRLYKLPTIILHCHINNAFDAKYASNGGSDCSYFLSGKACWPWYYAQAGINVHAGFTVKF